MTRLVEFCKATLTQWFRVPLRPATTKFEMHQIHRNLQAASPSDLNEQLTSVSKDKKLFDEIKQKLINFKFPLKMNKNNIKKIEDILKINICVLA